MISCMQLPNEQPKDIFKKMITNKAAEELLFENPLFFPSSASSECTTRHEECPDCRLSNMSNSLLQNFANHRSTVRRVRISSPYTEHMWRWTSVAPTPEWNENVTQYRRRPCTGSKFLLAIKKMRIRTACPTDSARMLYSKKQTLAS
ncbi:hypothetical protein M513_02246 [Trichuris suis]|uniref:Uncharacterized protein n=1 Tax=Trichuris suis TaxID=68888 RepID=A0A085MIE3_9BILA|nr:hypothetical protein M513_02246 [Trichuris suis]